MTAAQVEDRRVALVTGGSRGLGRALTAALVRDGWHVITNGRDGERLEDAAARMAGPGSVTVVAGNVADAAHRRSLAAAVQAAGGLDVAVNNAGQLGPSPPPRLADFDIELFADVFAVNTFAPLALVQVMLPHLVRRGGRIVNISSDVAVEAFEGWGGYGSSKAALDYITTVLALEHPGLFVYGFDPGDMRTDMQQASFPGEDISDRASPETVVPALMRLLDGELPSGRYRAADLSTSR